MGYVRPNFKFSIVVVASFLSLGLGPEFNDQPETSPATDSRRVEVNNPSGYFHPAWDPLSIPDSGRQLDLLVRDPDRRLESVFRPADKLVPRVKFWMSIYATYSSWMKVVHDRDNLEIVYGYLDFTPLYLKEMPESTRRSRMRKIERDTLAQLRQSLRNAHKKPLLNQELLAFMQRHQLDKTSNLDKRLKNLRTQSGQRDYFLLALHRSRHLLPQLESIFLVQGLPAGLARIPFVESSFDKNARSKVQARGMWQFMPRTAKQYIHRKNRKLWADPFLQTAGAARMLKQNRNMLPDWGSTITSYNSGVGRVRRLIAIQNAKSVDQLIHSERSPRALGFAGNNFYAEFLAAHVVEAYQDAIFTPAFRTGDYSLVFDELAPKMGDVSCLSLSEN